MIKDQNNEEIKNYFLRESENKKEICLDDFAILQILNENQFGFVAKVRSLKNGNIYVMNKYNLKKAERQRLLESYKNQFIFLEHLENENICKYYKHFLDKDCLYIIMEYVNNGSLYDLIKINITSKDKINEEKLVNIFLKCIKSLDYLHSRGIIHREIRPTHILLDNSYQVKLIDFKNAAFTDIEKAKDFFNDIKKGAQLMNQNNRVGRGDFRAPEINNNLESDFKYDEKIDVYAMGITFCSLAYSRTSLPAEINENKNNYSKELYEIIKKMVHKSPKERPSSKDIYNDLKILYCKKYFNNSGIISAIKTLGSFPGITELLSEYKEKIPNTISYQCIDCVEKLKELKNKDSQEKKEKLEKMWNLSIYEFRELLRKKGLINLNYNKEINPIYILCFLLKEMHKELNYNEVFNVHNKQLAKKGIHPVRESKREAFNIYITFYKSFYASIISDNFFGAIKTKTICTKCNKCNYYFNLFYFLPFDIQFLVKKYSSIKNKLNIYNAFDCLNRNFIHFKKEDLMSCEKCKDYTEHNQFKQFYSFPKYLIIYFNRGLKFKYKNFVNFDSKLKLCGAHVETFNKNQNGFVYDLYGIICRIEEYDKNQKNKRKEKYISFIKLNNENKYLNCDNEEEFDLNEIKNTGDAINLLYFCKDIPNMDMDNNNNNNNNNIATIF